MSSSSLSSLSSALSSDEDISLEPPRPGSIEHYFKNASKSTPPDKPSTKPKRPPSPPHKYVLADNADIAFICMFRSRFSDAFQKSLPHFGPQDVENGVADQLPSEQIERLLCALLGLVLNRKKDVERGHFQRALEEAIQTHHSQWPLVWQSKNPLHGGGSFNNMSPEQRLALLKALILWSLASSETIQGIIKESYKQSRHDDDLNQPLSVQPWGRDGEKRRYWLVEGQDDTHFRLYRESNPTLKNVTWRSVAGTIEDLKLVGDRLDEEGSQHGRKLHDRIKQGIPRFEASEEKRKRRDYRLARKAQFTRPEPGFSLYEGRTRGKRIKYTFSDEEDAGSDSVSTRLSNRQSGVSTPAEPVGPTFTASGRQVRSRLGGAYGESLPVTEREGREDSTGTGLNGVQDDEEQHMQASRTRGRGRETSRPVKNRKHIDGYNDVDDMDDESDATTTGDEWDGGDDDVDDNLADESDDAMSVRSASSSGDTDNNEMQDQYPQRSLVVSLRYNKKGSNTNSPKPGISNATPTTSVPPSITNGTKAVANDTPGLKGTGITMKPDPRSQPSPLPAPQL